MAKDSEERLPGLTPVPPSELRASQRRTKVEPARDGEVAMLQAQIVQLQKLAAFGKIAAGVVHEINNPLTAILAHAEHLERALAVSAPEHVARVKRILESVERILGFSRDLVAYARPSAHPATPMSIRTAVDQALLFCSHLLEREQVTVEQSFEGELPHVRAIPEQLVQVFVNLLTNACQAMDGEARRIVMIARADETRENVLVSIEDSGRGVPEERESEIFEPFFTTKRDSGGTGLGLSIVKSILEAHGGDIFLERAVPSGARFVVRLPVSD